MQFKKKKKKKSFYVKFLHILSQKTPRSNYRKIMKCHLKKDEREGNFGYRRR